ncbi:MAG: DciA family protein [Actinobacteria bacterium]|nr:DciA family protein [Actinomycetota bacterium]
MAKNDLALQLFKSFRTGKPNKKRSEKTQENSVRSKPTDPQPLSDLLTDLVHERQWKSGVAEGTLFSTWPMVIGEEISAHANPVSLIDGVLTLQTTSTAWATQLRLLAPQIIKTIQTSASGALVETVVILGPHAPSWRKGLRTIKGSRGPRDTYS